jgi:anthranilate phosphoribosyltransferase
MKILVDKLLESQSLDYTEAKALMSAIVNGDLNEVQTAAVLASYRIRMPSISELKGFRDVLVDMAVPVDLGSLKFIDLCGTGGDGKNTFNISTITSFVVAGAGVHVAKHGNYGVSSNTGSSNLLEYLGYKFDNSIGKLQAELEKVGICFMHAPLFHPALKRVGAVRKGLGLKTFFNILGPLVNPAKPSHQLVGVFNLEVARLYAYLLPNFLEDYRVVHSVDGYDEVTLTGVVKVFSKKAEFTLLPSNFGFEKVSPNILVGGENVECAAKIFYDVLKGTAHNDKINVVLANAALAISCFLNEDLAVSVERAKESLFSGKAIDKFNQLISLQK